MIKTPLYSKFFFTNFFNSEKKIKIKIYKGAKLLYCDHIFNGYGYSLPDFLKQLQKTKEDARLGKYLPYNFRFKYSHKNFLFSKCH